jgi:ferredoxin-NADP reductase
MQNQTNHYIFICDESSIDTVFYHLKDKLRENKAHHVSLIYAVTESNFLFKRELKTLKEHFYQQLQVFTESINKAFPAYIRQETLEVILNENTRDHIYIGISGIEDFTFSVRQQLDFLGIGEKNTLVSLFDIDQNNRKTHLAILQHQIELNNRYNDN